jgi:hypothetical protein
VSNYPQKVQWLTLRTALAVLTVLVFLLPAIPATTQSPPKTGVLRLRARGRIADSTKGLSRKRFFLVKGGLVQNKPLIDAQDQRPFVSRDCYYKKQGASQALISWLKESDCESVYCREIETGALDGAKAVPEFVNALAAGEKELGNRDLARKWLTNNVADNLRDGYYKSRQNDLNTLLKQAESLSGSPVLSVMTDRNGTAYFTDLEPGTYFLTSFLPLELGANSVTFSCEVTVKPGDIATEKPYLVSNNKNERNVKCVGVERPLPTCDVAANPTPRGD